MFSEIFGKLFKMWLQLIFHFCQHFIHTNVGSFMAKSVHRSCFNMNIINYSILIVWSFEKWVVPFSLKSSLVVGFCRYCCFVTLLNAKYEIVSLWQMKQIISEIDLIRASNNRAKNIKGQIKSALACRLLIL